MDQSQKSIELCMIQLWSSVWIKPPQRLHGLQNTQSPYKTHTSVYVQEPQLYILPRPLNITMHSVACFTIVTLLLLHWKALSISESHKTQIWDCCPDATSQCSLSDDKGHFELGGWFPDVSRSSWLEAKLRVWAGVQEERRKCGLASRRPVEPLMTAPYAYR